MDYATKDKIKFSCCNKLISKGAKGSSSWKYSISGINDIQPDQVNCGEYHITDIVGVSVNGNRRNRVLFNKSEVLRALEARVTIVKDTTFHTNRPFNIGERDLESFLIKNNYVKAYEYANSAYWCDVRDWEQRKGRENNERVS